MPERQRIHITATSNYQNWCYTNCTNGSESGSAGSLSEYQYLWLDYSTYPVRDHFQLCSYSG